MVVRHLGLVVCFLVAVTAIISARAEPTDADKVARLIAQLGSDDFKEREVASLALKARRSKILATLIAAELAATDPEIRKRLGEVIGTPEVLLRRVRKAMDYFDNVHGILRDSSIIELHPADLIDWTIRALYKRNKETLPDVLQKRLSKARDLDEGGRSLLFEDALRLLCARHELQAIELADQALPAVLARFDPHTRWIVDREPFAGQRDTPMGIGLELAKDTKTGWACVVTPIKDGPAYRAGLRADDLITHMRVNADQEDQPAQTLATADLKLDLVNRKLMGKLGTWVQLTVRRPGAAEAVVVAVRRGRVDVEPVLGWRRQADDSWNFWLDEKNRLGYVRVRNMDRHTSTELAAVLQRLEKGGLRGLILDLRFNPGMRLDQTLELANQFLDKGRIVTCRPRESEERSFECEGGKVRTKVPLVCLINGDTCHSSEVLAACLQDHKRAVIVGEKSAGKASIQSHLCVDYHDLMFTTSLLLRPSGKKLDRMSVRGYDDSWGVTPDVGQAVTLPPEERAALRESLDRRTVIRHRDQPAPEERFIDRQLERARRCLQDLVRK